jgi:hypothetical protein
LLYLESSKHWTTFSRKEKFKSELDEGLGLAMRASECRTVG